MHDANVETPLPIEHLLLVAFKSRLSDEMTAAGGYAQVSWNLTYD